MDLFFSLIDTFMNFEFRFIKDKFKKMKRNNIDFHLGKKTSMYMYPFFFYKIVSYKTAERENWFLNWSCFIWENMSWWALHCFDFPQLYVSPKLTGIVVCVVPPLILMSRYYGSYQKKITKNVQDSLANATQVCISKQFWISNIKLDLLLIVLKN